MIMSIYNCTHTNLYNLVHPSSHGTRVHNQKLTESNSQHSTEVHQNVRERNVCVHAAAKLVEITASLNSLYSGLV